MRLGSRVWWPDNEQLDNIKLEDQWFSSLPKGCLLADKTTGMLSAMCNGFILSTTDEYLQKLFAEQRRLVAIFSCYFEGMDDAATQV